MGIGNVLKQRAIIRRLVVIGEDAYGNDETELQIVATEIPCRVWTKRASANYNETTNIYERALVCAFLKSADIANGDKLEIHDTCGNMLYTDLQVVNNPWTRERYIEAPVRWIA